MNKLYRSPTDKQKQAFIQVFIKNKTHAEAGEKLKICRSAVTRRILRIFSINK